ncbi:MAG: HD-like signal output (HDOD) protein [Planctomycetota bacterium]|jgi:HD-like signal output (HDOD) protein
MPDPTALRKLLRSNLSIPTMPAVVQKINALIGNPETGTRDIGQLVSEDGPLTAKVLRIANSAYYGLASECRTTEHASTILGVNVLKNIVTQVAVINQFADLEAETGFRVSDIWTRASLTAQIASLMCNEADNVRVLSPEEFYVCGLLHKIGQVVMLDSIGKPYAQLLKRAADSGSSALATETAALGFNHQDVGAVVAKRWDLPDAVIDAIQYHGLSIEEVGPRLHVHLITVASRIARYLIVGDADAASAMLLSNCTALGMNPERAIQLLDKVDVSAA